MSVCSGKSPDDEIDSCVKVPQELWERILSQLEYYELHDRIDRHIQPLMSDIRQHFDGPENTD